MSLFAGPGSSTSIARTRSLRAPSKHTLTAAPQIERQQQSTTASNGNAGRGSPPENGGSGAKIPSATSNLALFLTNLRLLDLDLEPDWPDITPATFAARDAAGGQKKRIQAVEWTLYQLFVLWDPSEAHNKLRPFYPPADQVQSVNLRAALTRSLEAAKKNGSLGRDTIIRKTMLDECKGERLEEVLAAFSSAVLKKLVAEKALNSGPEYYPTLSEKLAVEDRGYTGDRTELNGLLLAHKASLANSLTKKNEERARYQDFEELLSLKERTLARRREQVKVSAGDDGSAHVSDQARSQVRNILRTNWTGNDRWVGTLLHGGADARTGGLLDAPFDEVWDGVRHGRLSDLEEKDGDLLVQLDQRVRAQKTRLEKWETFHHKMFGVQKAAPVTPKKTAERPKRIIEFKSHANAHLAGQSQKNVGTEADIPVEYDQIMLGMEQELSTVGKRKIPNFAKMFGSTSARLNTVALAPEPVSQEPVSDISEWEDDTDLSPATAPAPPPKPAHLAASRLALPKKTETTLPRRNSVKTVPARQNSRKQRTSAKPRIEVHEPEEPEMEKPSEQELLEIYERTRKYMDEDDEFSSQPSFETHYHHPDASYNPHSAEAAQRALSPLEPEIPITTPPSPPLPASPTRMAADEILAYMAQASPSPTKRIYKPRHTLSLAERTRMTMTRTQSSDAEESNGGHLSPMKANHLSTQEEPDGDLNDVPAVDDLVERTRKSMAGFEAARQKAQLERRRSQRKGKSTSPRKDSYFPRVQEEEGGAGGDGEGVGDVSVMNELIMQEGAGAQDYEAVFRSRPKMRMSPAASPAPSRWRGQEEEM